MLPPKLRTERDDNMTSESPKKWSTYQEEIFAWAKNPVRHLMIKARAGTGKTTTIVELYKRLIALYPNCSVQFMAFNKKIVTELEERMVPAMTMNSFGSRCISKFKPMKLDTNKIRNLCKINGVEYKKTGLVTRCVDLLKAYLYPMNGTTSSDVEQIISDYDLSEDPIEPRLIGQILSVFESSLKDLNTIDFADQIAYPIYHNMSVPKSDYIIIDEAQDLSPNKLELVSRAVGQRFICVGDDYQAIYGFAGADSESMNKIQEHFDPIVMSLPQTYRCGKRIVQETHDKGCAPVDFEAGPDNHEGEVRSCSYQGFFADVQPKNFVLCRVTAPLVSACFKLIQKGTRAQILGRDVGKKLVDLVDKIISYQCDPNDPITASDTVMVEFAKKYTYYRRCEVSKLRAAEKETQADNLEDSLDCLFVFTEDCHGLQEMKSKIERMFDDSINPDSVIFSSIHKSKGLEADKVFCLSYKGRVPKKEKQKREESNLLYVQITRAKNTLVWVGQR